MGNHCLTLNEVDAENRKLLSMSKGTQNYIKTTWIAILQRFIIIACSKQTLKCMHKNDWRLFTDKNSFDFMNDRSTYEFHYFWTYAMYELISSYPRTIQVVISIHEPFSLIHVFQVYNVNALVLFQFKIDRFNKREVHVWILLFFLQLLLNQWINKYSDGVAFFPVANQFLVHTRAIQGNLRILHELVYRIRMQMFCFISVCSLKANTTRSSGE